MVNLLRKIGDDAIALYGKVSNRFRNVVNMARPNSFYSFDIQKYMGTWQQVFRTPNSFQNNQAVKTTATYSFKDNGVEVINTETLADGSTKTAKGRGVPVPNEPTKLWVSFFPPFSASYWILDVGNDNPGIMGNKEYNYALVGSPYSNAMWILAKPDVHESTIDRLKQKAQDMGFYLENGIDTPIVFEKSDIYF